MTYHRISVPATTLFDARGRPRLASIQQALGGGGGGPTPNDTKAPFLYISILKLEDPHHRNTSWIGAQAIRSLLMETALKDQWSLAAYIPDAKAHFSQEEEELESYFRDARITEAMGGAVFDDEDQKQEDAWNERRMVLVQHDMRQFLQAGFLQEPETVQETNCFFLYAVPSQLEPPLLSQEATMAIPIHEKRKAAELAALSSSNHHHAVQLLEKFKSFCSERNELANQMLDQQDFVASSITDHPQYPLTDGARALVLGRENIRLQEQKCRDMNIILDNALQVATEEHQLRRV